jgi:hypothetical protein
VSRRWGVAVACLTACALLELRDARAVVIQIDGTTVPTQPTRLCDLTKDGAWGDNAWDQCIQSGLNVGEAWPTANPVNPVDALRDARTSPELFYPYDEANDRFSTVEFWNILHGGGYTNVFGWYNADDPGTVHPVVDDSNDLPAPRNPTRYPSAANPARVTVSVDFQTLYQSGVYHGGLIGFYLFTPENRTFYTENALNADGNYVHYLIYASKQDLDANGNPTAYYFGFEDLFRGGDNDFDDSFFKVKGLVIPCDPNPEVCDGSDNDCDGLVDGNDPDLAATSNVCSAAANTGVCAASTQCVSGAWACVVSQGPQTESCNGLDDDCDGSTDESLTPVTELCTAAQERGECDGQTLCVAGAWRCETIQGPVTETCNGKDDDCDGQTDENLVAASELCTAAQTRGECDASTQCSGGSWKCVVSQGPATEVCDGKDNNCNGTTDDLPNGTQPPSNLCSAGQTAGACEAATQCSGGAWRCVASQGPVPETCNGVDDDCDGAVDDDVVAPTNLGCSAQNKGICTFVPQCNGAAGWSCGVGVPATTESCNGLDDDCDGTVDDLPGGTVPPSELCGVAQTRGECDATTQCSGGAWRCVASQGPVGETCNGKDDDCDGSTDEDVVPPGNLNCSAQNQGICTYAAQCNGAGGWTCARQVNPTTETCNGLDDNCDGTVDNLPLGTNPPSELCTAAQTRGECDASTRCTGGSWRCVVSQGPVTETCNNKDDDCNGKTDDNLIPPSSPNCSTQNVGICTYTATCNGSAWVCTAVVGPKTETCNGLDDDCDGAIDRADPNYTDANEGKACTPDVSGVPICGSPTLSCLGGVMTCQGFTIGDLEICDGEDNDCDGQTDEDPESLPGVGLPCGESQGECIPGSYVCAGKTGLACVPVKGPSTEVCDGKDNDCDGFVDENPGSLPGAGAACSVNGCGGNQVCENGQFVCKFTPGIEVCDGLDNDCDGQTDEDLSWVGRSCQELTQNIGDGGNVGRCAPGKLACAELPEQPGTKGEVCAGEIGPADEVCNGEDDDCDGLVDEDPDGTGPEVISGELNGETVYQGANCGDDSRCGQGAYVCRDGKMVCDGTVSATSEVCDNIDNDCDGDIDEPEDLVDETGSECGSTYPPCTPGRLECVNGKLECVGATTGTDEVCNGEDDDCDGLVDNPPPVTGGTGKFEGEGDACAPLGLDGELMSLPLPEGVDCKPGAMRCLAGQMTCVGALGPRTEELCNNRDDDCDGLVDDDAKCPPRYACYEGTCVPPCESGEFPCSFGDRCESIQTTWVKGEYCIPADTPEPGSGGAGGASSGTGGSDGLGAGGVVGSDTCAERCQEKLNACKSASASEPLCAALCKDGLMAGKLDCFASADCSTLTLALDGGELCGVRFGETGRGGAGGAPGGGSRPDGNQDGVDDGRWGLATGGGGARCSASGERVSPYALGLLALCGALAGLRRTRRAGRSEPGADKSRHAPEEGLR